MMCLLANINCFIEGPCKGPSHCSCNMYWCRQCNNMPARAFNFHSVQAICLVLNSRPRGGPIETGKVLAVSAVILCWNPFCCSPDLQGPALLNGLSAVPHPVVSNCPTRGHTLYIFSAILNTLLHLQCPISILK